ncbi:hypothetical protein HPB50_011113 [Hyalomma asiaticum]|uniref:Uncharacterized protein n=1 Tax=Hyalomma asiaticum TaxID=266040 RepID=A0ACB7SJX5_HYAAI|nr:hypothetical protein HPB50_011113 [Hyalomma asiaticum]
MVKIWKRKQENLEPTSLQRDAAAGRQSAAAQGTLRRPTDGAPNSTPSPQAKQRKWRPRQTPRLSRDDYIVVLKPRIPCDAIRAYLGDQTAAQVQVWPIWEQNIIICSTTVLPQAQQLLGDFQLPVGDQQLPVTKASGQRAEGSSPLTLPRPPKRSSQNFTGPKGPSLDH